MTSPAGDLFAVAESRAPIVLGAQACVLRGFAVDRAPQLLAGVEAIAAAAAFRHLVTPGGRRMAVAMTCCGTLGWTSDARGYRYERADPLTGHAWPAMPGSFATLASEAAQAAGFDGFVPDSVLVNRYVPGTKLSLHQDRDECDLAHPIVSVSLGLPATFQFGGDARGDRVARIALFHGDVVVWGGVDRLRHHGILPLADGHHELTGAARINLTFRRAG